MATVNYEGLKSNSQESKHASYSKKKEKTKKALSSKRIDEITNDLDEKNDQIVDYCY